MRLGSSTDKKDSGRLHVDFAQARDDFYEWECKQRMLAREERHRRKMEEDRLRPPSPPAIMHYSEHEAALLAEKLKGKQHLILLSLLFQKPSRSQNRGELIFLRCIVTGPVGFIPFFCHFHASGCDTHPPARNV